MNFIALIALLGSASAYADDTYNFYFQKAPGPTTVNQGSAGQGVSKDTIVNPVSSPTPTPTTVAQAAQIEPETESTFRNIELSFGIAGSSSTDKTGVYQSSIVLSGQYMAGLQVSLGRYIGVQGEAFYLAGNRVHFDGTPLSGSKLDYSGALVVTPFRLSASNWLRISLSAVGGWMTIPAWNYDNINGRYIPVIEHRGTLFYGGRIGFELWNRVALQATIKRTVAYDNPNGTLAVAALF